MLKSRQLAFAIAIGTFCTTTMIGMASAQTVPTITARAGEVLHIPYTVNATAASKVGYHWGNKDGAMVGFLTTSKGWINAIHGEPSYQSASVPVYGFGPSFANGTKQPGENVHGNKGTFVFKLPSNMKVGTYTLALYYVDGIDRHVEMERMITVGDVHTSTTSLSLTANPIMPTVGSATTLTVTMPPDSSGGTTSSGDYIVISDNGGTWSTTPKSDSSWLFTPSSGQSAKHSLFPSSNGKLWTMQKNQQGYYSMSDVLSLSGLANGGFNSLPTLTINNIPMAIH